MTLQKPKTKRITAADRKRLGQHHRHSHNYVKTYWPYLPVLAIVTFGFLLNGWLGNLNRNVLGYASDISIQSLLNGTNAQRINNGLPALQINGQLDEAAQNKANDMAARDYWSHNTPDGQTPWSFISATGYQYQTAGENLAYGFATSDDTITGWMNSPEHRANILNTTYQDVGFGIVNIPNYQGSGPETLVVAMYARPATPAVAAATPAPSQSAPAISQAPTTQTAPQTTSPLSTANSDVATPKQSGTKHATQPTPLDGQQRVARIQLLTNGQASWSLLAVSLLTIGSLAFLILRHGLAWHRVLVKSERFILHHPFFDILAVSLAVLGLLLNQTSGLIR